VASGRGVGRGLVQARLFSRSPTMATPRRIYGIYRYLAESAEEISDFLVAKGDKVSSTLALMIEKDRTKLLRRWGEEMTELCGVLEGTHKDPYIMEANQTFYWASLFAASTGTTWDEIDFPAQRKAAATSGISSASELSTACARLVALNLDQVKPAKLFLFWNVADTLYRAMTPADQQFTLEQIMETDLHEMRKRPYLEPVLRAVAE
jgi:phosphoribosyl-ATP pyrophosphohydrolase